MIQPVRSIDGVLATPLYEFHHPNTESTVSLVGMMHIGERQYYQDVQDYIDWRSNSLGATVQCEGVIRMPDQAFKEMDPAIAQDIYKMRSYKGAVYDVVDRLGLCRQADVMPPSPDWENHDVTEYELAQMLGSAAISRLGKSAKSTEGLDRLDIETQAKMLRASLRLMPAVMTLRQYLPLDARNQAIINGRNQFAIKGVADTISEDRDRSITMPWGCNHVPGLYKGLERLGYIPNKLRWLGAVSLKNLSLA